MSAARDRLLRLLAPTVAAAGLDLEDVGVRPAGRRRVLRVVVDRDGGVSLDEVAAVSQAISEFLDASDAMGSAPYVLEVTSPGVDRPLTEPRHWRRAASRLVRVSLAAGGEIIGRVVAADDLGVTLDVAGDVVTFGHDQLVRGRVQLEFRRTDSGGVGGDVGDDVGGDVGDDVGDDVREEA